MSRFDPPSPKDEIFIKEIGNWQLSFSTTEKCLCIDTTAYHPFTLKLSQDDLKELLETVNKMINKVKD